MGIITIPRTLREKLGDDATDALAEVIREVDLEARKDAIVIAEERFERRLTEEIAKVNERITEEISKLRVEMYKFKSDILRWMFLFWIGQIGVLSGIIFAMLKLYFR